MFCDKCGQELDDKAIICPNCGTNFKTNKKTNKIITGCLIAFIAPIPILAMLIAIGSNASETPQDTKTNTSKIETKSKPRLEVLKTYNCQLSEYGGNAACGIVVNNTNKTMSYVQVEINLYDMNDNQIGPTIDNVNNLAAGSKWKFKAPVITSGQYRWAVVDVQGW